MSISTANSAPLSLKALVLRGSSWTLLGAGAGQVLRLASNLLLTRLLFPEAFGLMALVWMVLFALDMLSDMGLGPAIVREPRGTELRFLKTVWTLQVFRGVLLTIITLALAAPVSDFYGEPELLHLIQAAALVAFLNSFISLSRYTEQRNLRYNRTTLLELFSQISAIVTVIAWALVTPSVWALLGGAVIGRLVYLLGSHLYLPKVAHGFALDRYALTRLLDFGKWIFPSSILAFVALQGDRVLLGYYVPLEMLGIYSVAVLLTEAATGVLSRLNFGVAFPAYGRVHRDNPQVLRATAARFRAALDPLAVFPAALVIGLGSEIVRLLYDERYHDAGWMLQALFLKAVMTATLANSEALLVASGHPKYAFWLNAGRTLWIVIGIPVGWHSAGLAGVVWAVALSEVPVMLTLWFGLIKKELFSFRTEFRSLAFMAGGIATSFLVLTVVRHLAS